MPSSKTKQQKAPAKDEPNLDKYTSFKCNIEMKPGIHKPFLDGHVDNVIDEALNDEFSFVVIPLQHPRYYPSSKDNKLKTIADRSLSSARWKSRVVLDLNAPQIDCCKHQSIQMVERLFSNAFYLNASVILIDCPTTQSGCTNLATIINNKLRACPLANIAYSLPLVLIKVRIGDCSAKVVPASSEVTKHVKKNSSRPRSKSDDANSSPTDSSNRDASDDDDSGDCNDPGTLYLPWHLWNNFRDHLVPDTRIGICLTIESNLPNRSELDRWKGEPVHMVFIPVDNFVSNRNNHPVLLAAHQRFIIGLGISMSLKFSLVLTGSNHNAHKYSAYCGYLRHLLEQAKKSTLDELVDFEDTLQIPLQPLSSNLESITYETFEMDIVKYIHYQEAIRQALIVKAAERDVHPYSDLDDLLPENFVDKKPEVTFTVLVVGAGRGPLVDACIEAARDSNLFCLLKIIAVEKNPNSVVTLEYRKRQNWSSGNDGVLLHYEVTIIESDMRKYIPPTKADIVVSELLGSLADNELSPECLDGVWQAVHPNTISIPQSYSSYIAPVHCPRLHSKVNSSGFSSTAYDSLYVVRLMNHYRWDSCQSLFAFDHFNLSLEPEKRDNYRYKKLYFSSDTDVLCHGFAGYFDVDLYRGVTLSTVPGRETTDMHSWFPAYIPLETPVFVKANEILTVEVWRKYNESNVWYEWVVTSPFRTRIHTMNHTNNALSKFI